MSESEKTIPNMNTPERVGSSTGVVVESQVETSQVAGVSPSVVPRKKFPAFLLILLAAIVSVSIYVMFQNKTIVEESTANPSPVADRDPTTDWQTYTNTKYGITAKIPSLWELTETPIPNDDKWFSSNLAQFISPEATMFHEEINGGYYLTISINKPTPNYSDLNEYLNFSSDQYKYVYTNKVINGINGYIFSLNGKESGYVAEKDGMFFIINWITDQDPGVFNQILSTFKFTDSLGSNIYKNEKFGISFEIPEGVMLDTSYSEKYTSDYWEIKLNIQDNDDILIQKGGPTGWTDCKKNVAEKTGKVNSLEYSYFKEIDDFEVCKLEGTSTYVGWYATISDGPLDRNDNNSWFISAKTESTDQIYRQKIESVFFKVLNTFKSLDVLP